MMRSGPPGPNRAPKAKRTGIASGPFRTMTWRKPRSLLIQAAPPEDSEAEQPEAGQR